MFSFTGTFALARIGSISHVVKPMMIKVTHKSPVFNVTYPLVFVYLSPRHIAVNKITNAITDPQLKGKPKLLTKKISRALK